MTLPAPVGRAARLLGYAGLLPQTAIVAALAAPAAGERSLGADIGEAIAFAAAFTYAAVILSFLGGIWWGFAMRRSTGQAGLAAIAVVPSLIAAALVLAAVIGQRAYGSWSLVLLGATILSTLLVDRHLVATGEAPAGWMALRIPLSLGLGVLTIAAGALIGR